MYEDFKKDSRFSVGWSNSIASRYQILARKSVEPASRITVDRSAVVFQSPDHIGRFEYNCLRLSTPQIAGRERGRDETASVPNWEVEPSDYGESKPGPRVKPWVQPRPLFLWRASVASFFVPLSATTVWYKVPLGF